MRRRLLLLPAALLLAAAAAGPVAAHEPTCSNVTALGIEVHGHHVVRDYVVGGSLEWPPHGQVGSVIAGRGAATPGGPGPGFHFPNGFAPGASFCTDGRSPGLHLG
jgi:hypothetical protein